MRFKDKSILITGASGGIGGETALGFAGQGGSVALNYLTREENAEKTAASARELGVGALNPLQDLVRTSTAEGRADEAAQAGGLLVGHYFNCILPPAHPDTRCRA